MHSPYKQIDYRILYDYIKALKKKIGNINSSFVISLKT